MVLMICFLIVMLFPFLQPFWSVSSSSPTKLDQYSSLGPSMFDVVKKLNGISASGDGKMSETWSSVVAKSLFEHEYSEEIDAAIKSGQFNIPSYPKAKPLDNRLYSIARYMVSRSLRKVDREFYFVGDGGFDMHARDTLYDKFPVVNNALRVFINELKNQGIWEDTLIVVGSEFGR